MPGKDVIVKDNILKKYGLKNPNIVIYMDGNNIFIREFVTHYNSIQNEDNKDIGQIVSTLSYIQGIVLQYESYYPKEKVFYNLLFEKGRSEKHKKQDKDYKQNRNNKFLGLDFDEDNKVLMDKMDTFKYNMNQVKDIFKLVSKKINYSHVFYTEGDFQIRYMIEKYDNYFKGKNEDVVHIVFSTDSDFRQLLSDKCHLNVVIYDIIKKKLQTSYNYNTVYKLNDEINQDYFLFSKIFTGDKSDNIKGIKGCGNKTQEKLYGELKEVFSPHLSPQDIQNSIISIIDKKEKKLQTDNRIIESKEVLEKNYKMTNIIDINNVINMMSMNQIELLNESFNSYMEYREKREKISHFSQMKNIQKSEIFKMYNIMDHIDFLKLVEQVH